MDGSWPCLYIIYHNHSTPLPRPPCGEHSPRSTPRRGRCRWGGGGSAWASSWRGACGWGCPSGSTRGTPSRPPRLEKRKVEDCVKVLSTTDRSTTFNQPTVLCVFLRALLVGVVPNLHLLEIFFLFPDGCSYELVLVVQTNWASNSESSNWKLKAWKWNLE